MSISEGINRCSHIIKYLSETKTNELKLWALMWMGEKALDVAKREVQNDATYIHFKIREHDINVYEFIHM